MHEIFDKKKFENSKVFKKTWPPARDRERSDLAKCVERPRDEAAIGTTRRVVVRTLLFEEMRSEQERPHRQKRPLVGNLIEKLEGATILLITL